MKKTFENLCKCSVIAMAAVMITTMANGATAPRKTSSTTAKSATTAAAARTNRTNVRTPTTTATKATTTAPESDPTPEPAAEPEPEPETPIIVANKTSMFNEVMSEIGASDTDRSADELAEAIRRQRALLDGAANQPDIGGSTNVGSASACDAILRQCMGEKCGNDFSKCANDSTTIWGQKMDACRAKTQCTGHEYSLLAPEILADRDMNVRMAHYNSVINCGNKYNNCIFTQCGKTLNKCLAKKDGDNAISKCASIANECKAMDNGLASRVMGVFGDLRTVATAQVKKDEARLYELRDLMRNQCKRFGAMFDERTFDCVYTVNFFAGEDRTLMASKKLYSGDVFQCTPDWFGIDITTYVENAQRLTRSQTSASAAALGAGVGTAAGLFASGAIPHALDTQAAEKAKKEAEDCSATLNDKTHVDWAKYDANGNCVFECKKGYKKTGAQDGCEPNEETKKKTENKELRANTRNEVFANGAVTVVDTVAKGAEDTVNLGLTAATAIISPEAAPVVGSTAAQMTAAKNGGGNSIQQQTNAEVHSQINRFNGRGINDY